MKRIILGIPVLFCAIGLMAQPTLTFESHAITAGESNPMTYCKYQEVGNDGVNQTWNFTELEALQEFTGYVSEVENENFTLANTVLDEFGVRFYFDINKKGMYQTGYLSRNGKTSIVYTKAFEKVHFPFNYADEYTAPFSADYFQNNELAGQIEGVSEVKADAWGTILLPGDAEFKNTIRIRSLKAYTLTLGNIEQDIEMLTYRWYNSTHRYPLLVLTEITTKVKGDVVSKRTQAAYNSKAVDIALPLNSVSASSEIMVFPNPTNGVATLTFTSELAGYALIDITDMTGKEIIATISQDLQPGVNVISLDEELAGIPEGIYIIRMNINGEFINKELSVKR